VEVAVESKTGTGTVSFDGFIRQCAMEIATAKIPFAEANLREARSSDCRLRGEGWVMIGGGIFYKRFMILASLRVAVSRVHETAHFGEAARGVGAGGGQGR